MLALRTLYIFRFNNILYKSKCMRSDISIRLKNRIDIGCNVRYELRSEYHVCMSFDHQSAIRLCTSVRLRVFISCRTINPSLLTMIFRLQTVRRFSSAPFPSYQNTSGVTVPELFSEKYSHCVQSRCFADQLHRTAL